MKKLKKADEMEMSINFRSVRLSWLYSMIFLFVWNVVSFIKTGYIAEIPFILMCTQLFVWAIVKLVLTKKMSGDPDDDE